MPADSAVTQSPVAMATLRADAAAGLVVFLVALPLCLGIALASDAPLCSGVIAGIVVLSANGEAILITVVSLAILLFWETAWVKSRRTLPMVPGALSVVFVGVALNELFHDMFADFYLRAEDGHLVTLPAGGPRDFLAQITAPDWSRWTDCRNHTTGLTNAIVASIGSLLSLEASDKIDPERRISNPDRELVAQEVGNVLAGLLGGLPVTDFAEGAKHRQIDIEFK